MGDLTTNMNLKNNTYKQIYVDITGRCQLNCTWCANPISIKEMDEKTMEKICSELPESSEIRLLGGEPTLHPKLFDLVDIIHKHRHLSVIVSNGLMFSSLGFCHKLKEHMPVIPSLSLDTEYHGKHKMKALLNLQEAGFKRIVITATIVPDREGIISAFKKLKEQFSMIKYMHFRSRIQTGEYTITDLEDLVSKHFNWQTPYRIVREENCQSCGNCKCRWVTPDLQIMVLDSHRASHSCYLRGYIDDQLEINPFFKELKKRYER
jgi:MoaA/NifB/PqqE/SkfB family radical SAM enzyme